MGVTRKETAGTRFKVVLAKQGVTSPLFYLNSDQGMQETVCPAGIALGEAFRQARERNISAGITTESNEHMKKNFLANSTPYDSMQNEDFRDKPIW